MDQQQILENQNETILVLTEKVDKQNEAILTLSEKINELVSKIDALTVENKKTVDAVVEKKKLAKIIKVTEENGFVSVKGEYQTTSKIKDVLKGNGAKWDRKNKAWKFDSSEKDGETVRKLVQDTCTLMNLAADVRLEIIADFISAKAKIIDEEDDDALEVGEVSA